MLRPPDAMSGGRNSELFRKLLPALLPRDSAADAGDQTDGSTRAPQGIVALGHGVSNHRLCGRNRLFTLLQCPKFGGKAEADELCLKVTSGGVLLCGTTARWLPDA